MQESEEQCRLEEVLRTPETTARRDVTFPRNRRRITDFQSSLLQTFFFFFYSDQFFCVISWILHIMCFIMRVLLFCFRFLFKKTEGLTFQMFPFGHWKKLYMMFLLHWNYADLIYVRIFYSQSILPQSFCGTHLHFELRTNVVIGMGQTIVLAVFVIR